MRAKVDWIEQMKFVGFGEHNAGVIMDALPEEGGESTGVRPTELLLISLAGCTAMDVISILAKQKQSVTKFSIEIEGDRRDSFPKYFTDIRVTYRIEGKNINEAYVKRAIKLSEEKYCSVRATFENPPRMSSSYEITS